MNIDSCSLDYGWTLKAEDTVSNYNECCLEQFHDETKRYDSAITSNSKNNFSKTVYAVRAGIVIPFVTL